VWRRGLLALPAMGEPQAVDALELAQVWKSYPQAAGEALHALRDVSLRVPAGRVVAITGRSGSGKSTLLHLAAGIDAPRPRAGPAQ
jgi:ABC-type lipoprotein export system ATPase subunit